MLAEKLGDVKAHGYNLDFKNPHSFVANHGDPEELLAKLNNLKSKQQLYATNSRPFSQRRLR
jgi:hypothetical protein